MAMQGRDNITAGGSGAGQAQTGRDGMRLGRLPWPVSIYLFCIAVPLTFSLGPLAMSSLRLFLLVMVVPLTVQVLMGRFGRRVLPDILFPLHILWVAMALGVNNPDRMVQQVGSVGIEFLGGYMIARAYIRSPSDFLALTRRLVLLLLIFLPMSIGEALTNRAPPLDILHALPFFDSIQPVTTDQRLGLYRVQSIFNHPIHFGLFCSVVLSFCLVGMKGIYSDTRRYLSTVVITLNGFLALSSGALLAILLQLGLIVWFTIFSGIKWRWWLLIGLIALGYVTVDILSNRTPIQVFMSYATFSAHTAYWRGLIFTYGMDNVWANPLFGLGLNDWVRPSWMISGSVDNFWLVMAMRYGLPGFLILICGYLWALVCIMRRDFDSDPLLQQFRRAWVFSFIGMSFTLSTVHVWNNAYSMIFFMFGAGIWLLNAVPEVSRTNGDALLPEGMPAAREHLGYTRFPGRSAPRHGRRPANALARRSPS